MFASAEPYMHVFVFLWAHPRLMSIFVLKESVSSPRKFLSINTLIFLYCTYHIPAVVEFLHQHMIYSTYACTHQPLHQVYFPSARLELVQP